ncbi:lipid A biosynthesis acyltransferase [Bacteroidia bacterium]|nr:lipid A biosynthesis acyltransferase [Bacteroidia bacterium]
MEKWKGNTDGGNFGQKSLIFFLKYVDVSFLYPFVYIAVPFYMIFSFKTFRTIIMFFRKKFRFYLMKSVIFAIKNHIIFGKIVLDKFFAFADNAKKIFNIEIDNNELFLNALQQPKGFIILGSHVGNFEMTGYSLNVGGKKIKALVFAGETAIMQKHRSRILDKNNIEMIYSTEGSMDHLFQIHNALQNGDILSMAGDRSPLPISLISPTNTSKSTSTPISTNLSTIPVTFFGNTAYIPNGAFKIAKIEKVNIISIFAMKTGVKKYKVYVKQINSPQQYADALEDIVRKYPTQWFNFFDF